VNCVGVRWKKKGLFKVKFNQNSRSQNKKPLSDKGPANIGINQLNSVFHHNCNDEIEEGNVESYGEVEFLENKNKRIDNRNTLTVQIVVLICTILYAYIAIVNNGTEKL